MVRADGLATGVVPSLCLVVIGRNEREGLARLGAALSGSRAFTEIVYVDSRSTDQGPAVAASLGWRTLSLERFGVVSAAAGRHVGALAVKGELVLFLDGDMIPDLGEVTRLAAGLAEAPEGVAGVTGLIVDRFPGGETRTRGNDSCADGSARWFGGAVLLRRSALLEVGNWNPNVFANEELELHARLRKRGYRVLLSKAPFVQHVTERVTKLTIAASLVGVRNPRSPRNGGLGLAFRAALDAGSIPELVRLFPAPFLCSAAMISFLAALASGYPVVAAVALLGTGFGVGATMSVKQAVLGFLHVPQLCIGIARYRRRTFDSARVLSADR